MSYADDRYYKNSGAVPLGGNIAMLGIGSVAAIVVGGIYSIIAWYNPFIYVNFLLTLGFGFALGFAVSFASIVGKVRNRMFSSMVGVLVGLLGLYVAWIMYIGVVSEWNLWLFDPAQIFQVMNVMAEEGVWEIRGAAPTGIALWSIWGIEALVVLGIAFFVATASDSPFCESCQMWTDDVEGFLLLADDENTPVLKQQLEEEGYDSFVRQADMPIDPQKHLKLTLASCPNCEESDYLKVEQVTITIKDGDSSESKKDLVKFISIPHEFTNRLIAIAEQKVAEIDAETSSTLAGMESEPQEFGSAAPVADAGTKVDEAAKTDDDDPWGDADRDRP